MNLGKLALLGLGGAGLVYLFLPKERFIGERAKVGDVVTVPVISLPAGALPAVFPPDVGLIQVTVSSAATDTLDGMITGYVLQSNIQAPVNPGIGPLRVQRSTVTQVTRAGQVVAS